MSLLTRVLRSTTTTLSRLGSFLPDTTGNALTRCEASPGGLFAVSVRNIIRCHFPRPSERKRIKRHGFWKRMQTPGGQRVLMRRILKGKHVYSH